MIMRMRILSDNDTDGHPMVEHSIASNETKCRDGAKPVGREILESPAPRYYLPGSLSSQENGR
jgi:hypothetical protein